MTNVKRIATAVAKINQKIAKLKTLRKKAQVSLAQGVREYDTEMMCGAEGELKIIRSEQWHLSSLLKTLAA